MAHEKSPRFSLHCSGGWHDTATAQCWFVGVVPVPLLGASELWRAWGGAVPPWAMGIGNGSCTVPPCPCAHGNCVCTTSILFCRRNNPTAWREAPRNDLLPLPLAPLSVQNRHLFLFLTHKTASHCWAWLTSSAHIRLVWFWLLWWSVQDLFLLAVWPMLKAEVNPQKGDQQQKMGRFLYSCFVPVGLLLWNQKAAHPCDDGSSCCTGWN